MYIIDFDLMKESKTAKTSALKEREALNIQSQCRLLSLKMVLGDDHLFVLVVMTLEDNPLAPGSDVEAQNRLDDVDWSETGKSTSQIGN